MKLKIKENAIDPVELRNTLDDQFIDLYSVSAKVPTVIFIAKNKLVGAKAIVRKNSLIVQADIPNMWLRMLFFLSLVFLGVLLPLLLYFVFLHKKLKRVEKEVADFIKKNYSAEILQWKYFRTRPFW